MWQKGEEEEAQDCDDVKGVELPRHGVDRSPGYACNALDAVDTRVTSCTSNSRCLSPRFLTVKTSIGLAIYLSTLITIDGPLWFS